MSCATSMRTRAEKDSGWFAIVADDREINLFAMATQLESLGFEVRTASNGVEAVRACTERPPHLLVMDVDMPELSGIDAAQEIRECQRQGLLPSFPIMAWTASADPTTRRSCIAAGMQGFCEKPTFIDVLIMEIRRLLPGLNDAVTRNGTE